MRRNTNLILGKANENAPHTLVEHIERLVRELAGRVLVLNRGEPIAEGTPDEIAQDSQVREVYLGDGQADRRPLAAGPPGWLTRRTG